MSLEKMRLLNLQRNAELYAAFEIEKSKNHLWALKKKTVLKRLSEPLHMKRKENRPPRRSFRFEGSQSKKYFEYIQQEEAKQKEEEFEDTRKPEGTFGIDLSLSDAGTDISRKNELEQMFEGKTEVFNDSETSSQSLSDFVSTLKSLKMTDRTIVKMTPRRTQAMTFLPLANKALVASTDNYGHLAFWDVFGQPQDSICMQPHSRCITNIGVHREKPAAVFTSSRDGSLRVTDMIALEVREPFRSTDCIPVFSFDFLSPDVLVMGGEYARATLLDTREKSSNTTVFKCCNRNITDVRSISVHPVQTNIFAAATDQATVRLFDIRQPKEILDELQFSRGTVQWCRFSPCTGSRLLTSASNNEIRIYDTQALKEDKIGRLSRLIRHENSIGRFLSPFRPMWVPQREDCFLIGSVKHPREIELYDVETGAKALSLQHKLLSSINSQVAYHPSLNCLVGGDDSGRVHAFIP